MKPTILFGLNFPVPTVVDAQPPPWLPKNLLDQLKCYVLQLGDPNPNPDPQEDELRLHEQRLREREADLEDDVRTNQKLSFGGVPVAQLQSAAPSRHSYFKSRKMQRVECF